VRRVPNERLHGNGRRTNSLSGYGFFPCVSRPMNLLVGGGRPIPAVVGVRLLKYLRTVRGKHIALTGCCWLQRADLTRAIRARGGVVTSGAGVTTSTAVLVRGHSEHWAYGEFGLKEAAAAKRIREGQQLVVVQDYEFRKLIESHKPARCSDYVAGQPIAWLGPPPDRKTFDRVARIRGPLDREQTVRGRTEQAFLRAQLFRGRELSRCSLCGNLFPTELLVAAHIKPRSECKTRERRDACNIVFPLCLLGCDALYERGFASVDGAGKIVTTAGPDLPSALRGRLRSLRGRRCGAWREERNVYFSWHHQRRFRG
jgi:hypothetical protein